MTATGDTWNGVSAGETSWSWDSEAAEVSDDASTFAEPSITIHTARGFVPISIEAFEDAENVAAEVAMLLSDGKDTLEATAFATGSGSGEPFGFVTALSTTASVSATTNNAYGSPDVYKLHEALAAKHRQAPNAAFMANIAIWNDTDVFETSNGAKMFPGVVPSPNGPGTLL